MILPVESSPLFYRVESFGCKANQYEAQQIKDLLESYGFKEQPINSPPPAIAVIHSCAVTNSAMRESIDDIRCLRESYPHACIVLTGCVCSVPTFSPPAEATACIKPQPTWLQELAAVIHQHFFFPPQNIAADSLQVPVTTFSGHTRAFLKVQDGCNLGCSYCIVPRLRGVPRDKNPELVIEEASLLVQKGYKEIVVCGISLGLYGQKSTTYSLTSLLRGLTAIPNLPRIRLSSLHPNELTDELLSVWAAAPNMLPHIHLPLQSGSETILRAMRRNYTPKDFLAAVERARAALNNPAITTDVIVGFPGEEEADFLATCDLASAAAFSKIHVFSFSSRPETLAAKMTAKIPAPVIKERSKNLRALSRNLASKYHQQFIGKTVQVLVEGCDAPQASGYSEHYIPTYFPRTKERKNDIVPVKIIKDAGGNHLEGTGLTL